MVRVGVWVRADGDAGNGTEPEEADIRGYVCVWEKVDGRVSSFSVMMALCDGSQVWSRRWGLHRR